MTEPHVYRVDLDWTESRKGRLCSPEIQRANGPCVEVATPPQFAHGVDGIWSPEHLFTASVAACLMTTFLAVAEHSKFEFLNFSCRSFGVLDKKDGRYSMTEIVLYPKIIVHQESDRSKAERILQKAKKACLISNSIRSEVRMEAEIELGK